MKGSVSTAQTKLVEMNGSANRSSSTPQAKSAAPRSDCESRSGVPQVTLLDLPGEVLSLIGSYLSLAELLRFLSLHPSLLALTQSHLSPIRHAIAQVLSTYHPAEYPPILAKLPLLTLYLPQDPIDAGLLFIPILVQAEARWIVETLQHGRWPESIWKEAFERRFLPSWRRYKEDGNDADGSGKRRDTWRAAFLRVLGRLEHRNGGCTHEEAWTRFITLHRNGSASLNRIYSKHFDPYEIFAELKRQNNFADEPSTVRVILHLADVRILAVGVLLDRPNMFVNRNAHEVLHPPGLRDMREARRERLEREAEMRERAMLRKGKGRAADRGRSDGLGLLSSADSGSRSNRDTNGRAHRLSEPLISTTNSAAVTSASRTVTSAAASASTSATVPLNSLTRAITLNPTPTIDPATPTAIGNYNEPPKPRRSTLTSLFSRSWSATGPADSQNTVSAALIPLVSASTSGNAGSGSGWLGSMLTQVRSRDSGHRADLEDGKRKKSYVRRKSGSNSSPTIPAAALFGEVAWAGMGSKSRRSSMSTGTAGGRGEEVIQEAKEAVMPTQPGPEGLDVPSSSEAEALQHDTGAGDDAPRTVMISSAAGGQGAAVEATGVDHNDDEAHDLQQLVIQKLPEVDLAYPPMLRPQPAYSHRLYPNFTPSPDTSQEVIFGASAARSSDSLSDASPTTGFSGEGTDQSLLMDRRSLYDEVEDDYAGYLFCRETAALDAAAAGTGADEEGERDPRRFVEGQEGTGRKRWVGPMLIIAQLHPPTRRTAQPAFVSPSAPTEGAQPDLGANGTYISLGFEDIDALFPWLRLKGEGAYVSSAKRGGMGFAAAGDGD